MSLSEFLPYAPGVFEKLKIMILADSKKTLRVHHNRATLRVLISVSLLEFYPYFTISNALFDVVESGE
jgi:hypothetical protein